ncbi:hypothetical protein GCM10027275_02150 [Rhabdobacter roseus]|uniref:Lipocalin-like domain-containing protein n=1 Tax=Rhabdobacter roseus TaxID=1655419 RepID=A0A840TKL6_9BACT|nr:hypothetical protein [Rhabdobacter roseus]MBB5282102.1 hypothetical protein [Rhabdobacter roseus]
MKSFKKQLASVALGVLSLLSACDSPELAQIDAPLVGTWQLDAVTYGLTGITVRGDSLPFTESREYTTEGTFTIKHEERMIETGTFYTGRNSTGLLYQEAVYYPQDTTYQAYEVSSEGRLYLYERSAQGAVLADGATYEYKRQ